MPSATTIRKLLLQALEDDVLPRLQAESPIPSLLAELPVHLPDGFKTRHLNVPPLEIPPQPPSKTDPIKLRKWPEHHLNSQAFPYLVFVLRGELTLRMGVTTEMIRREQERRATIRSGVFSRDERRWMESGCHILSAEAPLLLLFPPDVPYIDGTGDQWEKSENSAIITHAMWLHVLPVGVLCAFASSGARDESVLHPLLVRDKALPQLVALYHEEMRRREEGFEQAARGLIQTLFMRVYRRVLIDKPVIGNTAWSEERKAVPSRSHSGASSARVIAMADEYIQLFLPEEITLAKLAAHCGVSATHLNRIFNASLNLSVKRYVARQRIISSQRMLIETRLSIKEIARLAGFRQVTHFSRVFHQIAGTSPRRYREENRDDRKEDLMPSSQQDRHSSL